MKLSFSINSSKPKPKPASLPKPASADDPETSSASAAPQFVTEFDPTRSLTSKPDKAVLAPIPNSDYIRRFKPSLPLPSAEDDPSQFTEANFVLDTNTSADPSGLPYGLSTRPDREKGGDAEEEEVENWRGRNRGEKPENLILKRFKEDMQNLPDEGGPDEFKGTELGDLAAALLRGYGWKEGKAIGRNKNRDDTKIVDYQKRGGTYGIGFNPSASDPKKNRRGDWILPDGGPARQKREKDLERERVSSNGDEREEEKRVGSRRNEERERVSSSKRRREEKDEERESKREEEYKEREKDNGKEREKERNGSREEDLERERVSRRNEERERVSSSKRRREEEKDEERESEREVIRWLRSHIRVRIISKDLKRGRYYLKKGEVVDVVGPTRCDISMDGTHELVQGVEQGMLETALPKKKGGAVLVLYGKHKGVFGNLVEKDLEMEKGVVRDADSHELVNVKLEQIAEYLGDPAYLGY